jgi:hypothetical protein
MNNERLVATPSIDYELWENASQATIVVRKVDTLGRISEERVIGGRRVQLTPKERRHNQEQAASDSLDVFTNGIMRPVRLLDDEEDTEVLQSNVNAMSEDAMRDLYKLPIRAFVNRVTEVSNPIALQRILELGSDVDATVKQVEAVKAHLDQVRPPLDEVSIVGGSAVGSAPPRAVSPR